MPDSSEMKLTDEAMIEILNHVGYYYRRLNDGTWKRIGGGWNKKVSASTVRFSTKQLFEMVKKQLYGTTNSL